MQSYRHCPPLINDKKENCQKIRNLGEFFTIGCVFYRVRDWGDLQIDLHVNLHDGFKIQFAGTVPVFRIQWLVPGPSHVKPTLT